MTQTPTISEPVQGLTPSCIDPKNMGLAMEFFTTIYSRPRDAVLRELAANGLDAQREAGYIGPVEVTLPTEDHPQLIVTDHGVGMSEQRLTEVFADYLESTKRGSKKAIGKFGVGCKTPAAVTDQYTIISTHEGVTTTMLMAKQVDSTTGHKIIDRKRTDRPSGTTITVPLAAADREEWIHAAHRTFYWLNAGSVLVDGVAPAIFHDRIHKDSSTKSVRIMGQYRGVIVRINGIGYQVPESMIRGAHIDGYDLVFEANTDDPLTISKSRETIDDTDEGRAWLLQARKAWLDTITKRTKTWLSKAHTTSEVAEVWARVSSRVRAEVFDVHTLRKLLEDRELPVHLDDRAMVFLPGRRNRSTDKSLLEPKSWFRQPDASLYSKIAGGLFITPEEFTDDVTTVMSRWRKGPGTKTALTVVDPSVEGFERFVPTNAITWVTGAEIIEQAPPKEKRARVASGPFWIEQIELTDWGYRRNQMGLDHLKTLAADGYNLVVGNRDDLQLMKRSLDPSTDVALMRGNRSLERLEELVGHPVYTPEQMITKHADDGLYEMTAAQRHAVADLFSLRLGFRTQYELIGILADEQLSDAARELITPWVKHLQGPSRNRMDFRAGSSLPTATVTENYPLTSRMLSATTAVDVQVLNALVTLDVA